MKRWLGIAGVALGVIMTVAAIRARVSREPEFPLYTVHADRFLRRVTAEGTLKAAKSTPVTAPADAEGPLKIAWIAEDASPVKSGEVVVRFDPTELENSLREGSIGRGTAQNKIAKQRIQSSATRGNLRLDAEQAQREFEAARTFQRQDADIFSRYRIAESEIDQDLAKNKKEHATRVQGVRDRQARADRELLEIEMRKVQLKIDQAEKGLRALEVRAPHDGILVLTRNWRGEMPQIGMTIWRGFTLGEIPDVGVMEAEVFVLEADAGGLAPGQKAEVTLESSPAALYPATVKKVDPVAKPRFRGVPVQYFAVTLELARTDPAVMKPGTRLRARLVLEDHQNALTIPRQALFEKKGKKIVHRWERGRFSPVEVAISSVSLGRVVVTRGLRDGDRIALSDPTASRERDRGRQEKTPRPVGAR